MGDWTKSAGCSYTAETEEATEEVAKDDTEEVINEVNSKGTEIVENKAEVQKDCGNKSDNVEKGQTVTPQSTRSTESTGQSGNTSQSENKAESADTGQSATSKNGENDTPEPTAPSTDITETPKPTEEPKVTEEPKQSMAGGIGTGIEEQIEDFLSDYPETRFIMIDTLQKIRTNSKPTSKQGLYGDDYDDISSIKAIADKHNIAIMLVHHVRKLKDTDDPFNEISGSTGMLLSCLI